MQQASIAAQNMLSRSGQPGQKFSLSRSRRLRYNWAQPGGCSLGGWKFHGIVAWLLWVVVHIYRLVGFRNRLAVLLDWAWTYLSYDRAVRLIQRT